MRQAAGLAGAGEGDRRAAAAEDWLHRLVAPPPSQRRSLSLAGARILAGQLRDTAEARQRGRLGGVAAGADGVRELGPPKHLGDVSDRTCLDTAEPGPP